ncbi:MAG: SDR family NAD(P)-dependent oxidoreductase [Caulobacteraceae bacterium]
MDKPLSGKVALVTGASRGIGFESALALAKAGAHIIAVARTQGGLTDLDDAIRAATGESATLVPLDLADGASVDQLGGAIHQRWGKLDLLVHAAATLGALTPVAHIEAKDWDKVMALNVTASYRLIRSLEPLLKIAGGRGLFFTSGRVARPRAFWGPYGASKAALEHLVRTWADEVENFGIRAALIDPGAMRTAMRAAASPGEDPMTLPHPSEIGPMVVELATAELGLPKEVHVFPEWKAARTA